MSLQPQPLTQDQTSEHVEAVAGRKPVNLADYGFYGGAVRGDVDMAKVDRNLLSTPFIYPDEDEQMAAEIRPDATDNSRIAELGDILRAVLLWLVTPFQPRVIAKKAVVMTWILRPEFLPDSSLRRLCRLMKYRVTAADLSRHAIAFREKFGIQGRLQKCQTARAAFSKSAAARVQRTGDTNQTGKES